MPEGLIVHGLLTVIALVVVVQSELWLGFTEFI